MDGSYPSGVDLRSLGDYQLRGIEEIQELFQVRGEGLLTDFPPPRTA